MASVHSLRSAPCPTHFLCPHPILPPMPSPPAQVFLALRCTSALLAAAPVLHHLTYCNTLLFHHPSYCIVLAASFLPDPSFYIASLSQLMYHPALAHKRSHSHECTLFCRCFGTTSHHDFVAA
jgi:hypothetical protein